MSMLAEHPPVDAVHEQVLQLIAQRWARSGYCRVTIRPGAAAFAGAGPQFQDLCPDLVGWQYGGGRQRMEWVAKVETHESLCEREGDGGGRWSGEAALGLPFFLFVPKGLRETAQQLALAAGVKLNGIYEYSFVNKTFQLL
jgi:hypothetical protein